MKFHTVGSEVKFNLNQDAFLVESKLGTLPQEEFQNITIGSSFAVFKGKKEGFYMKVAKKHAMPLQTVKAKGALVKIAKDKQVTPLTSKIEITPATLNEAGLKEHRKLEGKMKKDDNVRAAAATTPAWPYPGHGKLSIAEAKAGVATELTDKSAADPSLD